MKLLVHAHTTFSFDGDLSPREVAYLAQRRGFDAVLIADHFEGLTKEKFYELVEVCKRIPSCLLIPGYERSWSGYHVLALGVEQWIDDSSLVEWAGRIRSNGGMTVLAHPSRYRHWVPARILAVCDAVEVWNSKQVYDGILGPNPDNFHLLGPNHLPLCGQDLHALHHISSVATLLERPCSGSAEIMQCLRQGEYRMTNGFLRYGKSLSWPARLVLWLLHRLRRPLTRRAVRIRRVPRDGSASLSL